VEGIFAPGFVTWLWLWGNWTRFWTSVKFFSFSWILWQRSHQSDTTVKVVFTRRKTFSKQKQRLQRWWFYPFCMSLLQAYFCYDANRNPKLANRLMGQMSSQVITLPDGQKL